MDENIRNGEKINAVCSSSTYCIGEKSEKMKDIDETRCDDNSNKNKSKNENQCQKDEATFSVNSQIMEISPFKETEHSQELPGENTQMLIDDTASENNIEVTSKESDTTPPCSEQSKTMCTEKVISSELITTAETAGKTVAAAVSTTAASSTETIPVKRDNSSENFVEILIECDEDIRKGEESSGEKSLGEISQATTVDMRETDLKIPDSPPDPFASQDENDSQNQSVNEVMDFEDCIPSSQSDMNVGSLKSGSSESDHALVSRKRKYEDDFQVLNDNKMPRVHFSDEEGSISVSSNCDNVCNQPEELSVSKKSQSEESRETSDVIISAEKNKPIEVDDCVIECTMSPLKKETEDKAEESQGENKSSSDGLPSEENMTPSRKSVEIVFSSISESVSKGKSSPREAEFLPTIREENGESFNDSQDLVLRLSVSPSQIVVEEEEEKSEGESQTSNSSSLLTRKNIGEKSSVSNSCSSTVDSQSNSVWNSHSSDVSAKKSSEVVSIDEDDLQILPNIGKQANDQMKATNVVSQENGTSKFNSSFGDEIIVLDEGKSCSPMRNNHDANSSQPNRKRPLPGGEDADENEDKTQLLDSMCDGDTRKRSRLLNLNMDDRQTPDILPLPNKDSPAVSFVEVERRVFLSCLMRVQMHDLTKHIHSIELLECQDIEDGSLGTNLANFDVSPGNMADVSEQSKNSSPSSVVSLGPFSLKTQSWRMSSSSTSTSSSGHSFPGLKSRSLTDWPFTAPLRPAPPSRIMRERQKSWLFSENQKSNEFVRDLFELVEKRLHSDEAEPKTLHVPSTTAGLMAPPQSVSSSSIKIPVPEEEDKVETKKAREVSTPNPETPKSTKKSARATRGTRNANHGVVSKTIKEAKDEKMSAPQTPEKDNPVPTGTSTSQRKNRKTPLSRRTSGSVEEANNSTPTSRGRRNRNERVEKSETNSQEQSQHTFEWAPEGCFSKLVPDAPVFARWTDKKYYSGRIKEKSKDGRWVIEFDDNNTKILKDEFIIPVNILLKDQIVFAEDEDEYEQGIIKEFKVKNGEVLYGVDLDSGRKLFVPRSRIFMTEDQAHLMQENMDPKSPTTSSPAITTVTCDNIVQHKRPRSNRVLFGSVESPGVSGVAKTPRRSGRSDLTHDTSCSSLALPVGSSSSVSDSNDKGSTLTLDDVGGIDPEVPSYFPELLPTPSGRGKGPGRIKSKTRTPRRNAPSNRSISDTEEHRKVVEILGPIPEKGSKIFSDHCFLLTHAGVKPIGSAKVVVSPKTSGKKSDYTSSSDCEDPSTDDGKVFSSFPFVTEHLKKQIEAGGGMVYENFEDVPEEQYPNCLLLSDRPCLTAKYILCLANNIKIISHDWVIHRTKGKSYTWNSARLDAGWDLEEQCFVPAEATVRTRKQKPLNRKEVGLVHESQTFIKFWVRTLEQLGATVRHISPEQDREFSGVRECHVIVTDSTCPPEVQDRAREWSIPLVSPVWVTQSLIAWKARPYNGHPHYRYDHCSSD